MEHDRIRDIEKNLYTLLDTRDKLDYTEFVKQFHLHAHGLAEMLAGHFSKENRVLFPTAIQLFSDVEWIDIRKQFDDVGYCCFTPERADFGLEEELTKPKSAIEEHIVNFGTGSLSFDQLMILFKTLPVDITYVDENDKVQFYSEGPDRIFVRTPSVVGRDVRNCHPSKSVDRVLDIINGFRNNKLDKAEFWLELNGRMVFIRYFPLRNQEGEYKGVLEVTQDITEIRKIEGEKRLL